MKILMVCLGNICRSPLAEGILPHKTQHLNIEVDSAGTAGYHIVILPEGTRTLTGQLNTFKKGGFHLAVNTKARILPIITKGLFNIKPKNNTEGCLQDIHWYDGTFGYFPTYTLGALYAAQLHNKLKNKIPTIGNKIKKGEFKNLINWLRKNIHSKGSLSNSNELIKNITGEELNIEYFKKHLINRYLN